VNGGNWDLPLHFSSSPSSVFSLHSLSLPTQFSFPHFIFLGLGVVRFPFSTVCSYFCFICAFVAVSSFIARSVAISKESHGPSHRYKQHTSLFLTLSPRALMCDCTAGT
jgi:hypothetical protein